jgi:hypothetical protein
MLEGFRGSAAPGQEIPELKLRLRIIRVSGECGLIHCDFLFRGFGRYELLEFSPVICPRNLVHGKGRRVRFSEEKRQGAIQGAIKGRFAGISHRGARGVRRIRGCFHQFAQV